MHISDQVEAELVAQGWMNHGEEFRKLVQDIEEAGALSDGRRVVRLVICPKGRWLERVDGWGKVEREVDLRDYTDAKAAIKAVLTKPQ